MPGDSSDIDAALVAKLAGDATLTALLQAGASVFMDIAPHGSTRFVIVSLIDEFDEAQFGSRAFEDALYLVEARMLSTASGNIKAATARIDALLDGGTLTVAGYGFMKMHREGRVRATEQDEIDPSILWYRRGGRYRLQMST
jgi:hypothetical protein